MGLAAARVRLAAVMIVACATWGLPGLAPVAADVGSVCEGSEDADQFDDATGIFARHIECLGAHGITDGTGPRTYSPDRPVTRGQMAKFLVALIETATGQPLPTGDDAFTDDDGSLFEGDIDKLAAAGIVDGVGDGRYRPGRAVSRGEMAKMVALAVAEVIGQPLPDGTDAFPDDATSPFEAFIDQLAAAGVVAGYPDGDYRPGTSIDRGQMAKFLVEAAGVLDDHGHWAADLTGGTGGDDETGGGGGGSGPGVNELADDVDLERVDELVIDAHVDPDGTSTLLLSDDADVTVGTVLNSGPTTTLPDGFLGRATAVTSTGSGLEVTTEPVSLPEIIPTGDITVVVDETTVVTPPSGSAFRTAAVSRSMSTVGQGFSCGAEANASFEVTPEFSADLTMDASWGWSGVDASITGTAGVSGEASLSAEAGASCDWSRSFDGPTLGTVTVPVGPIVLVFTVESAIDLAAEIEAAASYAVTGDLGAEIQASLGYDGGSVSGDLSPVVDAPSLTVDVDPGSVEARADAGGAISLQAYGAAGIEASVGPFVHAEGGVGASPPCSVDVGIAGAFDLVLDVWLVDAEHTIAEGDLYRTEVYACPEPEAGDIITTTSLPDGTAGEPYSANLAATDGTAPIGWSVDGLPDGLTADSDGHIHGTPTSAGTSTVEVEAVDDAGTSDTATYELTIAEADPDPSVVLQTGGATADGGQHYDVTLTNFPPDSTVEVTCFDDLHRDGFTTVTVTTSTSGAVRDEQVCDSSVSGSHWVVADGVESNTIAFTGDGVTGSATGDPHMTTFDGLQYDMQAEGEFRLVESVVDDFAVHVRTAHFGTRTRVSTVDEYAVRTPAGEVVVYDQDGVTVDGIPLTEGETHTLSGGGEVTATHLRLADGTTVTGAHGSGVSGATVQLAGDRAGQVRGLLGDGNGTADDDGTTSDGRQVLGPGSLDGLSWAETVAVLYDDYALSWQVTGGDQVFPGDPRPFVAPSDQVTFDDFTGTQVDTARQTCVDNGWVEPELSFCAYDVLVTGDDTFADPDGMVGVTEEETTSTGGEPDLDGGGDGGGTTGPALSGTVVDGAGVGQADMCVQATGYAYDGTSYTHDSGFALTDADGHYEITDVANGIYRVEAYDCGDQDRVGGYHPGQSDYSDADRIRIEDDARVTGIDLVATPGGAVSGTLTRAADDTTLGDTGCVDALRVEDAATADYAYERGVQAQSDGSYRIGSLPPGDYVLRGAPCDWMESPENLVDTWYGGGTDHTAATVVTVEVAQTTGPHDIALPTGATLTGTVTGPGGGPVASVCVNAWQQGEPYGTSRSTQTGTDGTYRLTGLSAGDHRVEMWDCGDRDLVDAGRDVTALGAAETRTGIDVQLTQGGRIIGTVQLPSGSVPEPETVCVTAVGPGGTGTQVRVDGTFTLPGLVPGSYEVAFRACDDWSTIIEWWQDAATQAEATSVSVTADAVEGPLTVEVPQP